MLHNTLEAHGLATLPQTHGEALQALAAMSRLHEGGVQVLRGRMLAVDWAVAKSQFQASTDDQAAGENAARFHAEL